MKAVAVIVCLLSLSTHAGYFWDSEFPDNVDKFIYKHVSYNCMLSDYVDGLVTDEVIETNANKSYTADFSMYGDIAKGFVVVNESALGELTLEDLDCPRP
jgi:hypothetical protein